MGMSPLETIHVIDFEGNRTYGILEYALVTLKNGAIANIVSAKCCQNFRQRAVHFAEHSRFAPGEMDANFNEYLPFFIKKRMGGFFCAHGASVEDRLLRQYCPTPGTVDPPSGQCKNSPKFQRSPMVTERMEGISWGPWIDTHKIYRKYYPALGCYEVAGLIRHFGLEKKLENLVVKHRLDQKLTFHRAPYDALATALLLQNFIRQFPIGDVRFLLYR
jgi:hypothetical protein